ncbi:glucuronate isomerase [Vibrio chagasii]|nr:glucuronate isomerase [Vibrio chagasii]
MAWARTVPQSLGQPTCHWTHLELRRHIWYYWPLFGPETADQIWHQCNELCQHQNLVLAASLKQMNVVMAGTTDDPIDSADTIKRSLKTVHLM